MGFGRDLGAALTMGLSATTKHKEAERAHEKRCDAYQRRISAFNEVLQKTASSMQRLDGEYQSARDVLISSRARTIDADGNVDYGWYRPIEGMETEGSGTEHNQALIGTLPGIRSSHRRTGDYLDAGGGIRNRGDWDSNRCAVRSSSWGCDSGLDRQSSHAGTSRHDRRTRGIGPNSPPVNAGSSRDRCQGGRQ